MHVFSSFSESPEINALGSDPPAHTPSSYLESVFHACDELAEEERRNHSIIIKYFVQCDIVNTDDRCSGVRSLGD